MGFSTRTCLPLRSASRVTGECRFVGRQMSTASTFASFRSSETWRYRPMLEKSNFSPGPPRLPLISDKSPDNFFSLSVQTAASCAPVTFLHAFRCVLPMNPSPMTPTRMCAHDTGPLQAGNEDCQSPFFGVAEPVQVHVAGQNGAFY